MLIQWQHNLSAWVLRCRRLKKAEAAYLHQLTKISGQLRTHVRGLTKSCRRHSLNKRRISREQVFRCSVAAKRRGRRTRDMNTSQRCSPLCWPRQSDGCFACENYSQAHPLSGEVAWGAAELKPDLEASQCFDDFMFAADFPWCEEASDSPGRLRGLFNTNVLDGGKAHDQLRFQTPRSNEQDDLVQVLATLLSRSPSFKGHGVEACFEAARAAIAVLLLRSHGTTSHMGGSHFDDQQPNTKSLSDTPPELHVDAYGQGLSDGMRCDTSIGNVNITPTYSAWKHVQQHDTKKLKLNKKVKHGSVKKKVNRKSTKRPSHWRREALRRMFAGSQGLRAILRDKGNPVEDMNAPDVKPLLQAALTTPEGEIVVDLNDTEVPVACITEVALTRMFPEHDWRSTPASEAITLKPGGKYVFASWVPPAMRTRWPPCQQETLKTLCDCCPGGTKRR